MRISVYILKVHRKIIRFPPHRIYMRFPPPPHHTRPPTLYICTILIVVEAGATAKRVARKLFLIWGNGSGYFCGHGIDEDNGKFVIEHGVWCPVTRSLSWRERYPHVQGNLKVEFGGCLLGEAPPPEEEDYLLGKDENDENNLQDKGFSQKYITIDDPSEKSPPDRDNDLLHDDDEDELILSPNCKLLSSVTLHPKKERREEKNTVEEKEEKKASSSPSPPPPPPPPRMSSYLSLLSPWLSFSYVCICVGMHGVHR